MRSLRSLMSGQHREVPVARSDPQRATIVAVGGVAVAIVLGVIVLLAGSTASTRVTGTGAEFDAGSTSVLARRISADGGVPILFQDPARFTRPIWLQHLGEDDKTGWLAFDAAVGGCATTWDKENRQFADCSGRRYPNDGAGLGAYLVTIERDHVIVNLDPDAVTSTTAGTTTSSIQVTGG
jgi:hypothetical protein